MNIIYNSFENIFNTRRETQRVLELSQGCYLLKFLANHTKHNNEGRCDAR